MATVREELEFGTQYETIAAEVFARYKWGVNTAVFKLGKYAHIDFIAVDEETGEALGYVEVKKRRIPSTQYGTTMVNWEKHNAARFHQKYDGLPSYAIIVFTDTAKIIDLVQPPDSSGEVTRRDRNTAPKRHAFYKNSEMDELNGEALIQIGQLVAMEQTTIQPTTEELEQMTLMGQRGGALGTSLGALMSSGNLAGVREATAELSVEERISVFEEALQQRFGSTAVGVSMRDAAETMHDVIFTSTPEVSSDNDSTEVL